MGRLGGCVRLFNKFKDFEATKKEMEMVDDLAKIVTTTLNIEDVYEFFAADLKKMVEFDRIAVHEIDQDAGTYTRRYVSGTSVPARIPGVTRRLKNVRIAEIAATGKTMVIADLTAGLVIGGGNADAEFINAGLLSAILVPLISHGRLVAVLTVRSQRVNAFGTKEQKILERLANQIAPAIENARLYEEARRTQEEQRRVGREEASLAEIGRIIGSSLRFEDVYLPFFRQVYGLIPVDGIGIVRIDLAENTFTVDYREESNVPDRNVGETYPLEGSMTARVVSTGSTYLCHPKDRAEVERLHPGMLPGYDGGMRSYLCVPFKARDQITGALHFRTTEANAYNDNHVALAQRIGFLIGAALDNARLYWETKNAEEAEHRRSEELQALLATASILATGKSFADKVAGVMNEFARIADAEMWALRVLEDGGMRIIGSSGTFPYEVDLLPYEDNIPTKVIEEKRTLVIHDYAAHPLALKVNLERGVQSALCAPVMSNNSILGIVGIVSKKPNHFTPERVDLLMAIINSLAALLENARLEEEQKRTEERVQEAGRLASIGELAAGVAHEINNPLTSVLGYSELLLSEQLPEHIHAGIQTVYSEAHRAAKVVQNLLFFARRSGPEKRLLVLNSVIERALEMKSHDFRINNIRVTSNLSPGLPPTTADEHQMIQVILNILPNAEQSMQKRAGGQVTVRSTHTQNGIEISITDNGPGISPPDLHRIFEPFFTTKEVGEGTGLGLSVSYGIVKQHGGDIWAESIEGQGTTFHITLPVAISLEKELPPLPFNVPQVKTTKHLLVVDDEPTIRDLLRKYLEFERYTVDLAEDGNEAWRKLRTMEYDCILLDLQMPGMNGGDLYRLIADADSAMAERVIFITGDVGNPGTSELINTSPNRVLLKPFHLDDIARQVLDVIEATQTD